MSRIANGVNIATARCYPFNVMTRKLNVYSMITPPSQFLYGGTLVLRVPRSMQAKESSAVLCDDDFLGMQLYYQLVTRRVEPKRDRGLSNIEHSSQDIVI